MGQGYTDTCTHTDRYTDRNITHTHTHRYKHTQTDTDTDTQRQKHNTHAHTQIHTDTNTHTHTYTRILICGQNYFKEPGTCQPVASTSLV